MSVISKEMFYKNDVKITCDMFHTWSKSCTKASLMLAPRIFVGCSQFFLPIYLVQTALNYRNIDGNYVKFLIRSYARSVLYGFCYFNIFLSSNCILTKIFGRVHYYTFCLLCGFLAGLPVFIESRANRNLDTLYYFNLLAEAAVKNGAFFGLIKWTKYKETAVFMICSSMVSYFMKKQLVKPYNNLWFHSPRQYKKRESTSIKDGNCFHLQSCRNHVFDGFYKYFAAGYLVEMVKFVLVKYGLLLKNPKMIGRMLFNKNNILFGLVTGGYVGLYRIIIRALMKRDGAEQNYHHLIAGFLSGTTFFIKPNLQFACIAFTTLMQLLLQRVQSRTKLSEKWNGLLFSVINGILLHNRLMSPETCPKYIINMVSVCTNQIDKKVLKILDDIRRG